ncbi:unnamed protein product [Caenorhabditis sp. 36 PRJEB53466]|nr:unnamed protein product [Caenorhabditis sp. 36 PRJEB53466]
MRIFLFFLLVFGLLRELECIKEYDQYDDEDLALSIPEDAVGVPQEFRKRVLKEMKIRQKPHDIPRIAKYNKSAKRMETHHKWGCATLERGSGASHLTCNSWRAAHRSPKSIGCCYEGNYCNKELVPPPYAHHHNEKALQNSTDDSENYQSPMRNATQGVAYFFIVISILGLVFAILWCLYRCSNRDEDKVKISSLATDSSYLDEKTMMLEDSGSGSGQAALIQRTVRQDLTIIKTIGQGRYGEVRKAAYRGSYVAVKTFYTTDEDSWKNERDVYQTNMIITRTFFNSWPLTSGLGSLSDYLCREETLTTDEALRLIHSCICGIEHLHTAVQGTGSFRKPEIAHRDIKSKNIIVKRPGVCCIADLGLALRYLNDKIIPDKFNVQVGTKRYMAPELLSNTLNPKDFSQFKMADIYSMALVMWEVARRVEVCEECEEVAAVDETRADHSASSGIGDSLSTTDTISRMQHRQKTSIDLSLKAKPYVPPFDGTVDNDPSFDEMRDVVCVRGMRPPLESAWVKGSVPALCELSKLMKDCWHPIPQFRHTALKLKKETTKLIQMTDRQKQLPGKYQSISKTVDSSSLRPIATLSDFHFTQHLSIFARS